MHHYQKSDRFNHNIFKSYEKMLKFQNGNNIAKYDFEIKGNHLFIGNPYYACMDIRIEDNFAYIQWFGHEEKCTHFKGSKHMFLWGCIVIMKHFPNVKQFSIGDDTKIICGTNYYQLNKYYFLRYGKSYYEKYFDFLPEKFYGLDLYTDFIKKQYLSLYITNKWIDNLFNKEVKDKNLKKEFQIENEKMKIQDYLNSFNMNKKRIYCDIFYYLIDKYFAENVKIILPTSYFYKIDNRDVFIDWCEEKINKYFY